MKVGDRTLARFQSLWRMMMILGTVFIAGSVMPAGGEVYGQRASEPRKSVSARRSSQKLPARSAILVALGLDQDAYHAVAVRKGYQMKNPRSGLQATFTRQGVRVESGKASLGMALAAFGTSGKLQPVAAARPQAIENWVEYRRRALTEWYVNGPEGLEQGFTIAKSSAGSANGTPELALRLTGNLTASVDAARRALR
jgi:hypothetical protein